MNRPKTVVVRGLKKKLMVQFHFFSKSKRLKLDQPYYSCNVHFEYRNNRIRPWKIENVNRNQKIKLNLKQFLTNLKKSNNIIILDGLKAKFHTDLVNMFRDYQIFNI